MPYLGRTINDPRRVAIAAVDLWLLLVLLVEKFAGIAWGLSVLVGVPVALLLFWVSRYVGIRLTNWLCRDADWDVKYFLEHYGCPSIFYSTYIWVLKGYSPDSRRRLPMTAIGQRDVAAGGP